MNRYLEKIAEEFHKAKEHPLNGAQRFGIGWGANIAASVPLGMAASHFGRKLLHSFDEEGSANLGTVKKFMRDNKLRDHVTLKSHKGYESMFHGSGPAYLAKNHPGIGNAKGHVIGVRERGDLFFSGLFKERNSPSKVIKNKDILMHELGHAKDIELSGKHVRHLKQVGAVLGRGPIGKFAIPAASLGLLSNKKTEDYAAPVAAIPGALRMREELAANHHAYKGIKNHLGSGAANKFLRKSVLHNTLNYGIGAAIPVAGALLGKHLIHKMNDAREERNKKG